MREGLALGYVMISKLQNKEQARNWKHNIHARLQTHGLELLQGIQTFPQHAESSAHSAWLLGTHTLAFLACAPFLKEGLYNYILSQQPTLEGVNVLLFAALPIRGKPRLRDELPPPAPPPEVNVGLEKLTTFNTCRDAGPYILLPAANELLEYALQCLHYFLATQKCTTQKDMYCLWVRPNIPSEVMMWSAWAKYIQKVEYAEEVLHW